VGEKQLSATKERIDKFNVGQLHTPAEWQSFMDDGIILLYHPDEKMKDFAIEWMQKAISAENQQDAEKISTVGDVYEWLKAHIDYDEPGSEEKIWQRLVRVFGHQLNVLEEDVKPGASIVKDLGVE
jgi:hypothetical protein